MDQLAILEMLKRRAVLSRVATCRSSGQNPDPASVGMPALLYPQWKSEVLTLPRCDLETLQIMWERYLCLCES